ncbi:DNA methyltransferase [Crossiella sp. CA-258035]|uniref:TRM11 family SAM-dependent methyltransferase n=1 Tax=Crossiella sp. CA-258035 TaxID=2981138 RepID=UPI0024BC982E|nr:DNA methyltransferase [Crossiella sp. CA-258035]WHT20187.1 DNA methyltransferase [Crossiella sp. CA-258035]
MTAPSSGPGISPVWWTGQHSIATQHRRGGYNPATQFDRDQVPPKIAAHAIATFTRPGDLVLDPACGAGTVVTEALYASRRAIGLTTDPRWRRVARLNIGTARRNGAPRPGTVLLGDLDLLEVAEAASLAGQVDLMLTSLRGCHPGTPAGDPPGESASDNAFRMLAGALAWSLLLLRPGGYAVVVIKPTRSAGRLLDLTSSVLRLGQAAGLRPIGRGVALTARVRGQQVYTGAGLAERDAAHRAQAAGTPIALTAHRDVVIFTVPEVPDNLLKVAVPAGLPVFGAALTQRRRTAWLDRTAGWAA